MASQPNLSRPSNEDNYMGVTSPLLPQAPSITTTSVAATASASDFSGINDLPDYKEAAELEIDHDKIETAQQENSQEDRIPKIGMKFNTEEEAYEFYNAYALRKGFSIRKSSFHRIKNTSTIKNRTLCCSRAGARGEDKRTESSPSYGQCFSRPEVIWLVADKRYEEVKYDFKATQSTPKLKSDLRILRHAARIYTPAVFKVFQEQVMQTLNCDLFCCGDINGESVYRLKVYGKQNEHVVKFSALEHTVKCSCKKFEFAGILCCHALKILDINNIKEIPEQYILKRWTIDAKALCVKSNCDKHEDPRTKLSKRRKELCRMFVQVAARDAESEETYFMAVNNAEKLAEDVEKSLKIRSDPDLDSSSQPQVTKQNDLPAKPRGIKIKQKTIRGSARPISGFEKATRQRKKSKNDPKASGSATEVEIATNSQPHYTVLAI
ncbi:hypothetical protein ACP70R_033545 [Stipagrostis hirtigluma subsp. patula]